MALTKESFEALMSLRKRFTDDATISLNTNWTKDLESITTKDKFQLDYRNSKIEIRKFSINHRTRINTVLVRYCSLHRHTNPDGTVFPGAHIHLYREGFDDKIAFSVEEILGVNADASKETILEALMKYCNIEDSNSIQTTLELE